MNDESMKNLLRTADTIPLCGTVDAEFAARIRRRAANRKTARRAGGAAVVLTLLAAVPFLVNHTTPAPPRIAVATPSPSIAPFEEPPEIAASVAEQTAQAIIRLRNQDRASAEAPAIDPLIRFNLESEQTAAVLVALADKIAADPARAAEAVAAYRRVEGAFGSTQAAVVAAQRLRKM